MALGRIRLLTFLNYLAGSVLQSVEYQDSHGEDKLSLDGPWLVESAGTLRRFPLAGLYCEAQ